jgi:hypothetical protein
MPLASAGRPSHSANQDSTSSSTWLGPADSIQEPPYTLQALATKSPSAPGHVVANGMNAKNPR